MQFQYKTGKTGVILQGVYLYLEGIQVPFEGITINQGIGGLPSAQISIPPIAGLMDIARFYQPKVHIFFEDRSDPVDETTDTSQQAKARRKLLFSGHITGTSYSKSTSGSGSLSITFSCIHKNALISDCLIDYTGWIKAELDVQESVIKDGLGNSRAAIIEALEGINHVGPTNEISEQNPNGKTDVLPKKFDKFVSRYLGLPGVVLNFWNQLNRSAYNKNITRYQEAFIKLYKPLLEDGLQFFQRIGGHRVVEFENNKGKVDPCLDTGASSSKRVIVPPVNRLFMQSSIQAEMTISSLQNFLQASGEVTDIYSIFNSFYNSIDYEIITLASPAEVPLLDPAIASQNKLTPQALQTLLREDTYAVETLIKPKTPFYFSPTCNVIFPHMYDSISVQYDEAAIPTRVDMKNLEMPQGGSWGTHFRSPHSVRAAIADAAKSADANSVRNLMSTIASSFGAIGLYEQGRGIKIEYNAFPRWLSYLSNSKYSPDGNSSAFFPAEGTEEYQSLLDLQEGWEKRYPDPKDKSMSPWSKESGVSAHHRILFASADYYYSMVFARSKAGNVSGPFNPYIVPGYPMDVLDKSPVLPSFHALCTSVTHTITSTGISTSVSFAAATSYNELATYYIPFMLPALQVCLGLAKNPTLVGSSGEAREMADAFYYDSLGVGAAIPEEIYDFDNNVVRPIAKNSTGAWGPGSSENFKDANGGEFNPAMTYQGNMHLVSRPIESQEKYEERFNIKFVDLAPQNYSPTSVEVDNSIKTTENQLEIGASQFLDYSTRFGVSIDGSV